MSDTNIILLGGTNIDVSFRDGHSERVLVRELPIRLLPKFMELQDKEDQLSELYCDKPEGWDDTLLPESHERIIQTGGDLNFPILDRWVARKVAAVGKLTPAVNQVKGLMSSSQTSAQAQS